MKKDNLGKVRELIDSQLKSKGDCEGFTDADSLFVSSRLDSMDAMEMILLLEREYDVDFGRRGFDLAVIDSVETIGELVK